MNGECIIMRNFHSSYRSHRVIKSKNLRWNVTGMEEARSTLKIVTGKPTGKRPLGRPSRSWEDNIRLSPKEDIGANKRN